MPRRFPALLLLITFLAFAGGLSAGCASQGASADPLQMADMAQMPAEVQAAPVTVQQAYQFALANPEITQQLPCYCGCGAIGHTSNYDCYVSGMSGDGKVVFDSHALGCSICVDITQDTMRLVREGKDVPAIQVFLEQSYSRYGPSNLPG
jgi:Protein of unknown function with PCYCGC motif